MLGLPDSVVGCLFDLDGVLTRTAALHAAAWAQVFDGFLRGRAQRSGEPFVPFDRGDDYARYVDGRSRADGVRAFLASRGITLPEGDSGDEPVGDSGDEPVGSRTDTVHGLGNAKNEALLAAMDRDGVGVYEGSRRYVRAAVDAGLGTAVVSASANARHVLEVTGLSALFDVRVDGIVARERSLPGKPAPDTYLFAAGELGIEPDRAAVFEDALAGVEAGRAGGFGYVVGVDRVRRRTELYAHGADVVVRDLAELL